MTREEAFERFGKYFEPRGGMCGNPSLTIGHQRFSLRWDHDEDDADDAHREWFGEMLCIALGNLVEAETERTPNETTIKAIEEARDMRK